MPPESVTLDSTAVTYLGEPFTLNPVVSDILRTKYCVPGTIFLVEAINHISVSRSGKWEIIRLILGDGELCIQAILDPDMHRFVHTGDVALGAYVRCTKFYANWKDVGEQTMVTLVVDDLITIGWNESYRTLQREDEFISAPPKAKPKPKSEPKPAVVEPEKPKEIQSSDQFPDLFDDDDDEAAVEEVFADLFGDDDEAVVEEAFNAFDALAFTSKPQPKTPQKTPEKTPKTPTPEPPEPPEPPTSHQPVALPRDWHHPQTPLKLTILHQIPHLPYKQNWSCNVLAIVSQLSAVEPSNLPPYRQRIARLADPSTSKQVHLTVFLDPEKFNPRVGSAVLLVGVKNHRFDGGSLKKYESDRKNGRWWWENPIEMAWCDVEGIQDWWTQVTEATKGRGQFS